MGCGMGFLQIVVFGTYTLAFWWVSLMLLIFKTNGIRSKNNVIELCSYALLLSY